MTTSTRRSLQRFLALPIGLLPSATALAGGGGSVDTLGPVVAVVGGVALSYLFAHFVVDRLQRRLLFVTGFEYILLGVLLGPAVPQIDLFHDLTPLAPVIALAAGWIGLLYGMELDLRKLLTLRDGAMRLVAFEAFGTGLAVTFAARWFFMAGYVGDVPDGEAWMAAGVLGCTAAAGSSSAVELVSRRYKLQGGLVAVLRRASRLSDLVAIVAFGALFCIFHQGASSTSRPVTPTEWGALTVVLGVVLGLLFTLFLAEDESPNSRFLALVGIIAFASGAAFFLNLSSLLVNLLLGVVLVNTARDGKGIHETLTGTIRPMSLVLLVFAGALWSPPEPAAALLGAAGYVLLRVLGKVVGCWLGALGTEQRGDLARGLLAQGDVAVAMALSFRLVYHGPAVDVAYTVILTSVVLHELVAPRILKGLLVDAGEVRQEHPTLPAEAT